MLRRVPRQTACLHPDAEAGSAAVVPASASGGCRAPHLGKVQGFLCRSGDAGAPGETAPASVLPLLLLWLWFLWTWAPFAGVANPRWFLSHRGCLLRGRGRLQSSPDGGTGESQPSSRAYRPWLCSLVTSELPWGQSWDCPYAAPAPRSQLRAGAQDPATEQKGACPAPAKRRVRGLQEGEGAVLVCLLRATGYVIF